MSVASVLLADNMERVQLAGIVTIPARTVCFVAAFARRTLELVAAASGQAPGAR
jgi:hypothetical protein